MSDKLLDFLASSFIMLILIIELGLALLLTFSNISITIDFFKNW
jgi:hypothetical protein